MIIDNAYVNKQDKGLLMSFETLACALPRSHAKDYITAHEAKAIKAQDQVSPKDRFRLATRTRTVRPHLLGYFNKLPEGPDIVSHGFAIKKSGSFDAGVPKCFDFTLPILRAAFLDALNTMGPKKFQKSEAVLLVQRDDMQPGKPHRVNFGHVHDHMHEPHPVDLTYTFQDVMGTQFGQRSTPDRSLNRFGAEVKHNSPFNTTGIPLRRTFGSIIFYEDARPATRDNTKVISSVLWPENREAFLAAGKAYLLKHANAFHVIEPTPLSKVA